jgi:hypothetical protein
VLSFVPVLAAAFLLLAAVGSPVDAAALELRVLVAADLLMNDGYQS